MGTHLVPVISRSAVRRTVTSARPDSSPLLTIRAKSSSSSGRPISRATFSSVICEMGSIDTPRDSCRMGSHTAHKGHGLCVRSKCFVTPPAECFPGGLQGYYSIVFGAALWSFLSPKPGEILHKIGYLEIELSNQIRGNTRNMKRKTHILREITPKMCVKRLSENYMRSSA